MIWTLECVVKVSGKAATIATELTFKCLCFEKKTFKHSWEKCVAEMGIGLVLLYVVG